MANLLSNSASNEVDRSFYPTALQLLGRVEPIHMEVLRVLDTARTAHQRAEDEKSAQMSAPSPSQIAYPYEAKERNAFQISLELWPDAFEALLEGRHTTDSEEELHAALQENVLAAIWYLGTTGMIQQLPDDFAESNALAAKFLEWVQEPRGAQ